MNIQELKSSIQSINWLSNSNNIKVILGSEEEWDWLPTSRDQDDPFDTGSLSDSDSEIEKEVYKLVLKSLRSLKQPNSKLVHDNHDFTQAFKGAVLFTCKYTAREIITGKEGKWCEIFSKFQSGYWPCGLTDDNKIICL